MPHSRRRGTACALALVLCAGAAQASPRHVQAVPQRDQAILHLALPTRIEQRCNARAMGEIGRQDSRMRPDELVAYAFADPQLGPASIAAPGAAVRSAGHWYHLSYHCQTSPDGMDIKTFSYQLGAEVPRTAWSAHYLVP